MEVVREKNPLIKDMSILNKEKITKEKEISKKIMDTSAKITCKLINRRMNSILQKSASNLSSHRIGDPSNSENLSFDTTSMEPIKCQLGPFKEYLKLQVKDIWESQQFENKTEVDSHSETDTDGRVEKEENRYIYVLCFSQIREINSN